MNIEVVCPVCGEVFKTAVTEEDLGDYGKRVKCSDCWKSFYLNRASWRIVAKVVTEPKVIPAGQKKDSTSAKKARSKWSKKAHSEMTKKIGKR